MPQLNWTNREVRIYGVGPVRVKNQPRWWTPAPPVLWNSNVKTIACSHTQRDGLPCIWNLRWATDRPLYEIRVRTVEVLYTFTDACLTRMEPTVAKLIIKDKCVEYTWNCIQALGLHVQIATMESQYVARYTVQILCAFLLYCVYRTSIPTRHPGSRMISFY
jgi:hypothetical protein